MSLKDWITQRLSGLEADGPEDRGRVDLAVAALLVEVLRADYDVAPQERQQVVVSVSSLLGLDATVSAALAWLPARSSHAMPLKPDTSTTSVSPSQRAFETPIQLSIAEGTGAPRLTMPIGRGCSKQWTSRKRMRSS